MAMVSVLTRDPLIVLPAKARIGYTRVLRDRPPVQISPLVNTGSSAFAVDDTDESLFPCFSFHRLDLILPAHQLGTENEPVRAHRDQKHTDTSPSHATKKNGQVGNRRSNVRTWSRRVSITLSNSV